MSKRRESEIVDEIRQISNQYRAEVPSGRKAWPISIKDRVRELKSFGMADTKISSLTGISAQTIWGWKIGKSNQIMNPESASFLPVAVKEPSTVTVETQKVSNQIADRNEKFISTVTVVTPNGYRIEGLGILEIKSLLQNLESSTP